MDTILLTILILLLVTSIAILYLNIKSKSKGDSKDAEDIINSIVDVSMQGDELEINLIDQIIILHDREIKFDIDPINKECLVKGLDDIGSTFEKASFIDEFENQIADKHPWNIPK